MSDTMDQTTEDSGWHKISGDSGQKNNIVKNPDQEDCQQSLREILRAWLIDAEEGELKLGERIVVSRGWKPLVPAPALVQAQAIEIALAL